MAKKKIPEKGYDRVKRNIDFSHVVSIKEVHPREG